MRIFFTSSLFLALGLLQPVKMSFIGHPEDLEGSGDDLESSGSGDWSELDSPGEMKNSKNVRILPANEGGGTENTFPGSSVLTFHSTHSPAKDSTSRLIVVANSKSLLERKEVLTAVIAGGVSGLILAAALGAVLIHKWERKDGDGGYILGQQRASDEDYHKCKRKEVVV
uniref:syndecan-3-like n=1 Tax=Scatophagus argus TaxID=75038 RepID=UPI001ED82991|nr:syndecan-3-like [Scatophagus argus]